MIRWNVKVPQPLVRWARSQEFQQALMVVGGSLVRSLTSSPWVTVDLPEHVDPRTLPGVLQADQTQPLFPTRYQVAQRNQGLNWGNEQLEINRAHQITRGAGVSIAVLDTGWSPHFRLSGANIRTGISVVGGGPQDNIGHGTAILGIMASKDADFIGVAPDSAYHVIKVADQIGGQPVGDDSDLAEGIDFATRLRTDLINGSLGLAKPSGIVDAALSAYVSQGGVAVFAVGNFGDQIDFVLYPASSPLTVGVGAIDQQGQVPVWSNWGTWPFSPDCVAPGVNLPVLWLNNSTRLVSGTSAAAPFVTASLGLSMAVNKLNGGGITTDKKYGVRVPARTALARELIMKTSSAVSAPRDRSGFGMLSTVGLLTEDIGVRTGGRFALVLAFGIAAAAVLAGAGRRP